MCEANKTTACGHVLSMVKKCDEAGIRIFCECLSMDEKCIAEAKAELPDLSNQDLALLKDHASVFINLLG